MNIEGDDPTNRTNGYEHFNGKQQPFVTVIIYKEERGIRIRRMVE